VTAGADVVTGAFAALAASLGSTGLEAFAASLGSCALGGGCCDRLFCEED
jgi:hypothetical protein